MIYLISFDNLSVSFCKQACLLCPYIVDAFASVGDLEYEQTLHAPFASGAQLELLKQVLEAAAYNEANFLPSIGRIQIGGRLVQGQPFHSYVWIPELQTFLESLSEDQLTDLLYIADDMCAWPLRNGLVHFLLYRQIKCEWQFRRFFTSYRTKLAEIAIYIYESTTAAHSGYYGRPHNTHSD